MTSYRKTSEAKHILKSTKLTVHNNLVGKYNVFSKLTAQPLVIFLVQMGLVSFILSLFSSRKQAENMNSENTTASRKNDKECVENEKVTSSGNNGAKRSRSRGSEFFSRKNSRKNKEDNKSSYDSTLESPKEIVSTPIQQIESAVRIVPDTASKRNKTDQEHKTDPKESPKVLDNYPNFDQKEQPSPEKPKAAPPKKTNENQLSETPLRIEPIVFAQADFASKVKEIKKKIIEVQSKLNSFQGTEKDTMYIYIQETLINIMVSIDNLPSDTEQQKLDRKQLMKEANGFYKNLEEKGAEGSKDEVSVVNAGNLQTSKAKMFSTPESETASNSCRKLYIPSNLNKDEKIIENPDPTPPNTPVEDFGGVSSNKMEEMKGLEHWNKN